MKKSVALILIFAAITVFLWSFFGGTVLTGMQALDLPPPPPPPGQEAVETTTAEPPQVQQPSYQVSQPQVQQPAATTTGDGVLITRVGALEKKMKALDSIPSIETRLDTIEQQIDAIQDTNMKVNTLVNSLEGIEVDVKNANRYVQRPIVEQPTFMSTVQKAKINTIVTYVISILALVLVGGVIAHLAIKESKLHKRKVGRLKKYIEMHEARGYTPQELKEHLVETGWNEKLIEEAIK